MILVDTSAWVEFLRDTGSPVCTRVDELLDGEIATCDPIRMEVLAGARDESHLNDLRRLLARASVIDLMSGDYDDAAVIYRTCRRHGENVRKLTDCLIGAVAIRADLPVLQADSDFDVLAGTLCCNSPTCSRVPSARGRRSGSHLNLGFALVVRGRSATGVRGPAVSLAAVPLPIPVDDGFFDEKG